MEVFVGHFNRPPELRPAVTPTAPPTTKLLTVTVIFESELRSAVMVMLLGFPGPTTKFALTLFTTNPPPFVKMMVPLPEPFVSPNVKPAAALTVSVAGSLVVYELESTVNELMVKSVSTTFVTTAVVLTLVKIKSLPAGLPLGDQLSVLDQLVFTPAGAHCWVAAWALTADAAMAHATIAASLLTDFRDGNLMVFMVGLV
jgi:hypothetical protein